jgi:hypothetical protein
MWPGMLQRTLERKLGGLDRVTTDETIDVHDVAGVYEAMWLQSMRSKVPRRRRQSVQRTISIDGAWNVSAEVKGGREAWLPRDLHDSVTPWCPTFTEISLWLNCAPRSACEMHWGSRWHRQGGCCFALSCSKFQ